MLASVASAPATSATAATSQSLASSSQETGSTKRKFLQVLIHFLNDGRDALNVRQRFNIALADCSESRRAYEQMRVWVTIAQTQGKAC